MSEARTSPQTEDGDGPRPVFSILALALVYACVGRIGLLADPVGGLATLVWPPSGIALSALVLRGRWLWPGVAIGALGVNLWAGADLPLALGIALGNTLAAVLAREALARAGFDPHGGRVSDAAALVVLGALVSTLASASVGTSSLVLGGVVASDHAADAFGAWWLGDAMGDIVVGALVFAWTAPRVDAGSRVLEASLVALALAAAGLVTFGGILAPAQEDRSMYLLFPPLTWSAVRFGSRGAASSIATVSAIAVLGTMMGHGPFASRGQSALLELQSFMFVVAVMLLVLGAAIGERDRSRAAAIDALRVREDFLAIASHELRTPIATLVLHLGTLSRRAAKDAPDLSRGLARAEGQTERLGTLVANLLDASRIDRGPLPIDRTHGDLAETVRAAAERLREQAERAGSELRVSIDGKAEGSWDAVRMDQVVTNLLSNAIRHAREAPIEVTLRAEPERVVLEVRDHGPGIPPQQREEIFVPYRRGGAKREEGGLGLGLFIARSIVEAHGGTIRVAPVDAGTCFVVELPRPRVEVLAPP